IGSINRARWAAESSSRKARLAVGAATAGAPVTDRPSWRRRIGNISVRTVVRAAALLALVVALGVAVVSLATMIYLDRGGGMLPPEPVDQVEYLDQGWGPGLLGAGRQAYYYTPQGAALKDVRYSWFVNLEMPWGRERFADPDVL